MKPITKPTTTEPARFEIPRTFRHPQTLEGASVLCSKRGENNYVIAVYRGSEGGTPICVERGGIDAARTHWALAQHRLELEGFERQKTVRTIPPAK